MPYVLSRLANSQEYVLYELNTPNGIPKEVETITILGGADVADNRTLVTPLGVVTVITKKQEALLQQHPVFKQHLENGVVELASKKPEPEAAADNLAADVSRQITAGDYGKDGKEPPKTGAPGA